MSWLGVFMCLMAAAIVVNGVIVVLLARERK